MSVFVLYRLGSKVFVWCIITKKPLILAGFESSTYNKKNRKYIFHLPSSFESHFPLSPLFWIYGDAMATSNGTDDGTPPSESALIFLGTGCSSMVPNVLCLINPSDPPCSVCAQSLSIPPEKNPNYRYSLSGFNTFDIDDCDSSFS